jgi:membrane protein YqaA with SNARE-associated domain
LIGVFLSSFLAATVVPLSSEAVLLGFLKLHPEQTGYAISLATIGNTAGGMTSYLIGRLLPALSDGKVDPRALACTQRLGTPALLLAWLPLVGDALCVAAGWLRLNWISALLFMATGRLVRYIVVGALA